MSSINSHNMESSEKGTLFYWSRYLRQYLKERSSPLADDAAFIAERVEKASLAFHASRRQGMSHYLAQRAAMQALTEGL